MNYFTAENITQPHGFFTRKGGVSEGLYQSLNCGIGSKDDPAAVKENLNRVREELGAEHVLTLYQTHTPDCITVTQPWDHSNRPEGDAMITNVKGIALGILTADCAPVLFEGGGFVAAAHAGWKGAIGGVLDSVVKAFQERGVQSDHISAAIGPCISPNSYEVSDDFAAPFLAQSSENEKFFRAASKPGHLMFDLPGYCYDRLQDLGVQNITTDGQDTLTDEEHFFSYRRTCHRNAPDYGRQISAIVIK